LLFGYTLLELFDFVPLQLPVVSSTSTGRQKRWLYIGSRSKKKKKKKIFHKSTSSTKRVVLLVVVRAPHDVQCAVCHSPQTPLPALQPAVPWYMYYRYRVYSKRSRYLQYQVPVPSAIVLPVRELYQSKSNEGR
jgi:hypothetical protein